MDLFVLRIGKNIILKGGENCSFTDATAEFGIPVKDQWSTAFTAWWRDDELPHMVVGNYVDLSDRTDLSLLAIRTNCSNHQPEIMVQYH